MQTNPWKLTTLALLGGLFFTSAVRPAAADRQPLMKSALVTMQKAKVQLRNATADKGGHRAKAIDLLDQAIAETEAGIAFDNHH